MNDSNHVMCKRCHDSRKVCEGCKKYHCKCTEHHKVIGCPECTATVEMVTK